MPLVDASDGGDEVVSPILPIVDPADRGDELCSVAPPEVSALPDGGMVAALEASGGTVLSVGGAVGEDVSAAKTGVSPMANATAVHARRRVMSCVLSLLPRITLRLGKRSFGL